jgi:protease-4
MFENKLGITFDRFSTNAHSTYSPNRKLTASEISLVQEEVDNIYTLFLKRVAEGRGMSTETVNLYARGRVWNGVDAKRIGLVDELGGLQDAINYAAKTAGIAKENVTVIYYPLKKDDKFAQVLEILDDGDSESTSISRSQLPEMLMKEINQLRILEERTGVQMRMPFDFKLN